MDYSTQGALEIVCVENTDMASSTVATTTCSIANFGMLYLPFAFMLFLMVFTLVVTFFLIRIKKRKYD